MNYVAMRFNADLFVEKCVEMMLTEEDIANELVKKVSWVNTESLLARKNIEIIDQVIYDMVVESLPQLYDYVFPRFFEMLENMYTFHVKPTFSITEPREQFYVDQRDFYGKEKRKVRLKFARELSRSGKKGAGTSQVNRIAFRVSHIPILIKTISIQVLMEVLQVQILKLLAPLIPNRP